MYSQAFLVVLRFKQNRLKPFLERTFYGSPRTPCICPELLFTVQRHIKILRDKNKDKRKAPRRGGELKKV